MSEIRVGIVAAPGAMLDIYVGSFLYAVASTHEDARRAAAEGQATYDAWVQRPRRQAA